MIISNDRLVRGCQILSFLRDRALVERFVSKWYEICEGTGGIGLQFMMREWLKELWLHHGATLQSQDPNKIRALCEVLWRNSHTVNQL